MGRWGATVLRSVRLLADGGEAVRPSTESVACTKQGVAVTPVKKPTAYTKTNGGQKRRKLMNISALTGLPELPEGLIFRVGEVKHSGWGLSFLREEQPGAYVAIVRQCKIISEKRKTKKFLWWDIPFGYENDTSEHEENLVYVNIMETVTVDTPIFDDDDNEIGVKPVEQKNRIYADDLTQELIVAHAIKAYERWLEITKARGYLGDYPPKNVSEPEIENTRKPATVIFRKGDK